jgi:hypothetical protein
MGSPLSHAAPDRLPIPGDRVCLLMGHPSTPSHCFRSSSHSQYLALFILFFLFTPKYTSSQAPTPPLSLSHTRTHAHTHARARCRCPVSMTENINSSDSVMHRDRKNGDRVAACSVVFSQKMMLDT